jgi:type II secretory pathway pseudopilin PulG
MRRRRAFSLLEVTLVVVLMAIIAVVGIVNTRQGQTRGQTAGVAELVAEELRSARFRAISQNVPTAVVFPASLASKGVSQGLYVLEGDIAPRVVRSVRYDREYPDVRLFIGTWPSTVALGRDDVKNGANGKDFKVRSWDIPNTKDYVVMFTPSGSVKTNGLPRFGNSYHLAVCSGLTSVATSAPAGSQPTGLDYFALTSISSPSTVSIGASGEIRVKNELFDNGGLAVSNSSIVTAVGALPPAASGPGTNANPVVASAKLVPDLAPPFEIQPGSEAVVTVEAADDDGDPLYIQWTTNPANQGKFSSTGLQKMEWIPSPTGPGRYRATWAWTPNEGAAVGSSVNLTYQVTDGRGGSATGSLAGPIQAAKPGHIAFTRIMESGEAEIAVADPDGQNIRYATVLGDEISHYSPMFSPDGRRIASFGFDPHQSDAESVFVSNCDGTGLRRLAGRPDGYYTEGAKRGLAWSPNGTFIVASDFFSGTGLLRIDVRDGNQQFITSPPPDSSDLNADCCPREIAGETWIAFERTFETRYDIALTKLSGGGYTVVASQPDTYFVQPVWSPDGTRLAFCDDDNLWVSGPVTPGTTPSKTRIANNLNAYSGFPHWSPNGELIAYVDEDYKLRVVRRNGSHPVTNAPSSSKVVIDTDDFGNFWWSPDSESLVFDNGLNISTVRISGSAPPRITVKSSGSRTFTFVIPIPPPFGPITFTFVLANEYGPVWSLK